MYCISDLIVGMLFAYKSTNIAVTITKVLDIQIGGGK
jgi:hypothetical protein